MRRWFPPNAKPKCLYHVDGEVILERAVRCLRESGVDDIRIVIGYRHEDIEGFNDHHELGLEIIYNNKWETDAISASIESGIEDVEDDVLLILSDVVLRAEVIKAFLDCPDPLARIKLAKPPEKPELLFEYHVHIVKVSREKFGIFDDAREHMERYMRKHPVYRKIPRASGIAIVAALSETLRLNPPVAEILVDPPMKEVDLFKQTDEWKALHNVGEGK